MKHITLFILLCCLTGHAELIPANRLANWVPGVDVGVPGGILKYRPGGVSERTVTGSHDSDTVAGTISGDHLDVSLSPYSADKTGAVDCAAAVNAAIAAAGTGQVVYFPAGTYKIGSIIYVGSTDDNITIRGAGQGATILNMSAGSGFAVGSGSDYLWTWPSSSNTVSSTRTRGTTTLTIANASPFAVGKMIRIGLETQQDTAAITAGAAPQQGPYPNQRKQFSMVTAIAGNVLTINPPLIFDCTGLTTTLNLVQAQTDLAGIEDLTIDMTTGSGTVGIYFQQCYGCWALNVKVTKSGNYGIHSQNSLKTEIRHSFMDQRRTEGSNGGGLLFNATTAGLVEDNIAYRYFPLVEINAGSTGNVFGYNIFDYPVVFGSIGSGLNANHGPHNSYNLFEGNVSANYQSDGYFGGASEHTIFRNWLSCGVADESLEGSVALILNRFDRNTTAVGNVLGHAASVRTSYPYSFGNPNLNNGAFTGTASPSTGDFWLSWTDRVGTLTTRTSATEGIFTIVGTSTIAASGTRYVDVGWAGGGARMLVSAKTSTTVSATYANPLGALPSTLPPVSTPVSVWPETSSNPLSFQEQDQDVSGTVIRKDNYSFPDLSIAPGDASLGGDVVPDSLYTTKAAMEARGVEWGSLPFPPFSSAAPLDASYDDIPAGYRYVNGFDPGGGGSGGTITAGTVNAATVNKQ